MKQASKIALGGLLAAVSVVMLIMGGILPFFVFAMPALAGIFLLPVCVELGWRWGYGVYAVVSILALLLAPDREAVLFYIGLFGQYPVTKVFLDKIKLPPLRWLVKIAAFTASIAVCLGATALVFGMEYLFAEYVIFGVWGAVLFFAVGLLTLLIYDFMLGRMSVLYVIRVQPRLRRRTR